MVSTSLSSFISENPNLDVPWTWKDDVVSRLASSLREQLFPVFVARKQS